MNRRDFVQVTLLGVGAGAASFTGLGILDERLEEGENGHDGSPPRDTPTGADRTGTEPGSTTTDAWETDQPTDVRESSGDPESETTPSPRTDELTDEPTPTGTPTESPTATPEPWQGVESDFKPFDDDNEIYVRIQNHNSYTVDVTVRVTWGFEDGSEVEERRLLTIGADDHWAGTLRHGVEGKTVSSWGRRLTVEKH